MIKKTYALKDGAGDICDVRMMEAGEFESAQEKANTATDGEYGWTEFDLAALESDKAALIEALSPFKSFIETAVEGHTAGWFDKQEDSHVVFAWNDAKMTIGMLRSAVNALKVSK